MTMTDLPIRSKTNVTTDIGALWQTAIARYEETAKVKFESLTTANKVEEVLKEIHERESRFQTYRHDGSKLDEFRSLVRKCLGSIEKIGQIVVSAASSVWQSHP